MASIHAKLHVCHAVPFMIAQHCKILRFECTRVGWAASCYFAELGTLSISLDADAAGCNGRPGYSG